MKARLRFRRESAQPHGDATRARLAELATELARCRTITPEQNVSDDTCRRVWAESRHRFFARSSPRPNAAANDPATAVPGKDQDRLPSAGVQPERGEAR